MILDAARLLRESSRDLSRCVRDLVSLVFRVHCGTVRFFYALLSVLDPARASPGHLRTGQSAGRTKEPAGIIVGRGLVLLRLLAGQGKIRRLTKGLFFGQQGVGPDGRLNRGFLAGQVGNGVVNRFAGDGRAAVGVVEAVLMLAGPFEVLLVFPGLEEAAVVVETNAVQSLHLSVELAVVLIDEHLVTVCQSSGEFADGQQENGVGSVYCFAFGVTVRNALVEGQDAQLSRNQFVSGTEQQPGLA